MTVNFSFRLDELDEVECFGLVVETADDGTRAWFVERDFDGSGYSVHGLVDAIIRMRIPDLYDELDFSPEGDNLLILCEEREPLVRVQLAVEGVVKNEDELEAALGMVDPDIME